MEEDSSDLQRNSQNLEENRLHNGHDEAEEESRILFDNGQLSYLGKDCETILPELWKLHGDKTKRLDLCFNCLNSLHGLENFPNLEELILDNNNLSDDDIEFPKLSNLHTLCLNKNRISDIDKFIETVSSQLPSLTFVSLLGNKACPNQLSGDDKDEEDYQRYRYYVLFKLPRIKFLDSTKVTDTERQEANKRGQFLKVARLTENDLDEQFINSDAASPYSPLPNDTRTVDSHVGTFGVSKYVYYGKHSEGNRFIRNNDL